MDVFRRTQDPRSPVMLCSLVRRGPAARPSHGLSTPKKVIAFHVDRGLTVFLAGADICCSLCHDPSNKTFLSGSRLAGGTLVVLGDARPQSDKPETLMNLINPRVFPRLRRTYRGLLMSSVMP
jgi:hypothetical protein